MKVLQPLPLLACAVSALPDRGRDPHAVVIGQRDAATITNVINTVSTALTDLDDSVKAFDGSDFTRVSTASSMLSSTLQQGAMQIKATAPLSVNDAVSLQPALAPIQTKADSLISDLTAKKALVEQSGLCEYVLQQTQDFATQSKVLLDAAVAKVPDQVQQLAGQLTAGFTASLTKSQDAFAPAMCVDKVASKGTALPGGMNSMNMTIPRPVGTTATEGKTSSASALALGVGPLALALVAVVGLTL